MNRLEWIKEKRKMAERRYDTIFATNYDNNWGQIEEIHKKNLLHLLSLIPDGGTILDAACGTGKYWAIITAKRYKVLGIDQSQKMLDNATNKFPDINVEKIGLQEISLNNRFNGIICIDAMENVFPEEWILVLGNFHRALKKDGYLYFTVETISKDETEYALKKGLEMGFPVVEGEYAHKGGYHYYPSIEKVKEWINSSGFVIVKENTSDGYEHFILEKHSNLDNK